MPHSTNYAYFDIHEHDGRFSVTLLPNWNRIARQDGAARHLATFDTLEEAQRFCDEWRPDESSQPVRD